MRLIIENPYELDLEDFCPYVIKKLQQYLDQTELNFQLLALWDKYLKIIFPNLKINTLDIINYYFNNQIIRKEKDNYIITVNPNIKISGIPLEQITQTISQGTLDIKGYDIFSEIYNKVASEIDTIYSTWEALQ